MYGLTTAIYCLCNKLIEKYQYWNIACNIKPIYWSETTCAINWYCNILIEQYIDWTISILNFQKLQYQYWLVAISILKYCFQYKTNKLIGNISLFIDISRAIYRNWTWSLLSNIFPINILVLYCKQYFNIDIADINILLQYINYNDLYPFPLYK